MLPCYRAPGTAWCSEIRLNSSNILYFCFDSLVLTRTGLAVSFGRWSAKRNWEQPDLQLLGLSSADARRGDEKKVLVSLPLQREMY